VSQILKTFDATPEALGAIANVRVLQTYPAFTVVEAGDENAAAAVKRTGLTEDITANYILQSGATAIDTSVPRTAADGAIQAHPGYASQATLPRGPHHYIVQFVGPIRRPWLAGIAKAGGTVVSPYQNFSVIARATAKQAGALTQLPYVRWVGHLPYSARLSPNAAREPSTPSVRAPRTHILPGAFNVQFFTPELATAARASSANSGSRWSRP
jgi:serine protease AprX